MCCWRHVQGDDFYVAMHGLVTLSPEEHGQKVRCHAHVHTNTQSTVQTCIKAAQFSHRQRIAWEPCVHPYVHSHLPISLCQSVRHRLVLCPSQFRAVRKAFDMAVLSPASLTAHEPMMQQCVERLVTRLTRVAQRGEPVDMVSILADTVSQTFLSHVACMPYLACILTP